MSEITMQAFEGMHGCRYVLHVRSGAQVYGVQCALSYALFYEFRGITSIKDLVDHVLRTIAQPMCDKLPFSHTVDVKRILEALFETNGYLKTQMERVRAIEDREVAERKLRASARYGVDWAKPGADFSASVVIPIAEDAGGEHP